MLLQLKIFLENPENTCSLVHIHPLLFVEKIVLGQLS